MQFYAILTHMQLPVTTATNKNHDFLIVTFMSTFTLSLIP